MTCWELELNDETSRVRCVICSVSVAIVLLSRLLTPGADRRPKPRPVPVLLFDADGSTLQLLRVSVTSVYATQQWTRPRQMQTACGLWLPICTTICSWHNGASMFPFALIMSDNFRLILCENSLRTLRERYSKRRWHTYTTIYTTRQRIP